MKTALLLLLLSAIAASADVWVYSGTSVETRPGSRSRPVKVRFVYDSASREASLLVLVNTGHFYFPQAEAILSRESVVNADGRKFMVLFASPPTSSPLALQTHWQLASAPSGELTDPPRSFSGRFTTFQASTIILTPLSLNSNGNTPISQPADFSDQRLTLTLDRQLTEAAKLARSSYAKVLSGVQRVK